MMMRARLALLAAGVLAACWVNDAQAADAAADAVWSFDGHARAALREGSRESNPEGGLLFGEGLSGQALTIGSPDGKANRSVYTPARDLLNPHSGSLSFWVKPLDWHGGDAPFHIMLRAMSGDTYFLVYKYFDSDHLLFLIGQFEKWTSVRTPIPHWRPGQWHQVACTWSDSEITLWTDGHLRAVERLRYPVNFDRLEPLSVGPGGWRDGAAGTSLIDDLHLYRTVIGRGDIEQHYLRHAPAAGFRDDAGLITLGACSPVVDGQATAEEYAGSTTALVTTGAVLARRQSTCFYGYDDQRLYVAVTAPAVEAARAMVFLAPSTPRPARYVFSLQPKGGATATRDGAAWSCPGLQVREQVQDGAWTVEAAIPCAALGLTGPPHGQTWRGNVAVVFKQPEEWTSLAPVVGGLDDWSHALELRFRPDTPRVHFSRFIDMATGKLQPLVQAAGTGAAVTGALYSSTGRMYGDRTTNFTLWAEGRATPFAPAETVLSGERWFRLAVADREGTQERPLYQRSFTYAPPRPLAVLAAYTLHEPRQLLVTARGQGQGTVRVRFLKPDGTVALERRQPVPPNSRFFSARFDLDFQALTPGDYLLRVDHVAADEAITGDFEQEYRVPDLTGTAFKPYVDPQADQVPPPWTPLRTEAGAVQMWGRRYDLAQGCLVSGLQSQGQELLAAPVRLRLDGKELLPVAAPVVRRLSATDMLAEWEKVTDCGALTVRSRLTVHFDGYCQVALTVSPRPGEPVQVQSLVLEFPFRSDVIRLARDSFVSHGSKSGAVGDQWAQTLADRPMLWLGREDIGFNWTADDLSQWHFRQGHRNVEVLRSGDQAVVAFNLVDTALRLEQPRTFDFGFTVTPSRPLDPRLRRYRNDREWQMWAQPWKYFNYLDADQMEMWRLTDPSAGHDETFLYMSHNFISPFCPEWPYWEEQWRHIGRLYGECTGDLDLRPALRNVSCYAEACLGSDTYRAFHLRQLAALLQRAPLTPKARNYYFDFSYGAGCQNEHHGCSPWTDLAGKSHMRVLNAQTREVALATYRMIKRSDPEAKISAHLGYQRNMPVQHFSEIMVIGEGTEPQIATQGSYYDLLTPDLFRATYLPETFGMRVIFINQLTRAPYIFRPEKFAAYNPEEPETRRALLHLLGYLMVHDVDGWWPDLRRYRPVVEQLWTAQDAVGWDEQVAFHPYWREGPVRRVAPDSERVLASAYARQGKLLLAVLNDTDQAQPVTLRLDLAQLGLTAGKRGSDVWEPGRSYPLAEQWQDTVGPRGFRLILWGD